MLLFSQGCALCISRGHSAVRTLLIRFLVSLPFPYSTIQRHCKSAHVCTKQIQLNLERYGLSIRLYVRRLKWTDLSWKHQVQIASSARVYVNDKSSSSVPVSLSCFLNSLCKLCVQEVNWKGSHLDGSLRVIWNHKKYKTSVRAV